LITNPKTLSFLCGDKSGEKNNPPTHWPSPKVIGGVF